MTDGTNKTRSVDELDGGGLAEELESDAAAEAAEDPVEGSPELLAFLQAQSSRFAVAVAGAATS